MAKQVSFYHTVLSYFTLAKPKHNKPRRPGKQKSRQQQVAPASSPAVADPLSALREAIAEVRGRRAIALLERLKTVDGLAESERLRLTALAQEAQARELIANGHPREACDAVRAAAKRQPELAPFWKACRMQNAETLCGTSNPVFRNPGAY